LSHRCRIFEFFFVVFIQASYTFISNPLFLIASDSVFLAFKCKWVFHPKRNMPRLISSNIYWACADRTDGRLICEIFNFFLCLLIHQIYFRKKKNSMWWKCQCVPILWSEEIVTFLRILQPLNEASIKGVNKLTVNFNLHRQLRFLLMINSNNSWLTWWWWCSWWWKLLYTLCS
jgi:hypothetical protein